MLAILLTGWDFEPSVVLGVLLLASLYCLAAGPLRRRFPGAQPVTRLQGGFFLGGLLVILLALVSPIDELGDEYLFSAHMLQHALLILIAPPLLLAGLPGWMLRPVLRVPIVGRLAQIVTRPLTAFVIFEGIFLAWHLPLLYQAALENENIHIVEHLMFLAGGVVGWWPIFSPLEELPRLPYPHQFLYLFLLGIPTGILGALFVFAPAPVYPFYTDAPRITALSPLDDQQVGGLVMSASGSLTYLFVLCLIFFHWMARDTLQDASG
jgi:putative membrane protein